VSHLSYVRQKNRDHGVPLSELSLQVTDHDRERAEDTVSELERLGVYRESIAGLETATLGPPQNAESTPSEAPSTDAPANEPPSSERRRQQVTDMWGNPLGSRRRRQKG
jgi:hypothetical protein